MTTSGRPLLRSALALAILFSIAHHADAKSYTNRELTKGPDSPGRIGALKTTKGLLRPHPVEAVKLTEARVILADYPLIRHDFGDAMAEHYKKPANEISDGEVDRWLLDNAAYMSKAQVAQTVVNSQIPNNGEVVKAYRPHDYGRALVFSPTPGVLIDVKGSGADHPAQTDHANGLATLGEVIREYAYEHLVHKVLTHANTGQRTVGHYAVIDAGFDVKFGDGRQDRAGLILRQAHVRAPGDQSSFSLKRSVEAESTLRRYGITTAGAYQEDPYDRLNVQGTNEHALLDFGGFLVMPGFSKPAYHIDHAPDTSTRAKPLLAPGTPGFVQPDEAHRVPYELWGSTETGRADPIADNPWIWSHRLATSLSNGSAQRKDAEQHMHNLLDQVDERLKN